MDLSLLAVHPRLVELATALLRTDDLRIYSVETWAKYTGAASYEQWHHRDYLNHTPLVPSDDARFRQLEMWIYLSDVTEDHAPTRFVPRTITHPVSALPHAYGPQQRPDWYAHEVSAPGPAGSVLVYGADTFHRAVPLRAAGAARFTMQVNFRTGVNEWTARHPWGERSFDPNWSPFVERVDPARLSLFGFPPPGHPFWTQQTLAGLHERYPGLDTSSGPGRTPSSRARYRVGDDVVDVVAADLVERSTASDEHEARSAATGEDAGRQARPLPVAAHARDPVGDPPVRFGDHHPLPRPSRGTTARAPVTPE